MTLTKLQNPVKASFNSINDSLKETHGGLNKYTKSLDKVSLIHTAYPLSLSPGYILNILPHLSSSKIGPSLALSTMSSQNKNT